MAIPANTLMEEGKCYMCFGELSTAQILELALLRRIVLAADPAADVSPQGLISTTNCYACLGLSMFDLMLLALLSLLAGEDLPCGTVTTTIQFNAPSGGYDGQYVESSATLWLQTTPSADYGIRLVSGVWEVFEIIFPGPVVYSIPESQFPCGVWTQVAGGGPATAEYV